MKYIKPLPAPQKTFFFERSNGTWFAAEEYEASLHMKRRNNQLRLVGTSDGTLFHSMIKKAADEATIKVNALNEKLQYKKITQNKYDKEIDKINLDLLKASTDAKQVEYEASKGKIVMPQDPNIKRMYGEGISNSQQSSVNRMLGGL